MKKLYKISEFASICGVTREQLLHYDQIGLLHPAQTSDTGYRYYSLSQLRTVNIILTLKSSGMSLVEIGEYLTQADVGSRLGLLQARREALAQQERVIRAQRQAVEQTMEGYQEGAECQRGVLYLRHRPEEYLIASPAHYTQEPDEEQFLYMFRNHLKYCEKRRLGTRLQAGEIIPREGVKSHRFLPSHYFCPVVERVQDPRLHIKPAGMYGVYYHWGEVGEMSGACLHFVEEVERQGYELQGDIYADDLVDDLILPHTTLSVARLTAQLAKK